MADNFVDRALSRCPFLHNVCEREGPAYARSIAMNPLVPASRDGAALRRRPVLEEEQDLAATFRLFHGAEGAFPLAAGKAANALSSLSSTTTSSPTSAATLNIASAARCPFSAPAAALPQPIGSSVAQLPATEPAPLRKPINPLAGAPLATLSLGMPDFGEFLRRLQSQPKPKPKPSTRRPPNSNRPDIKPSAAGSTSTYPGAPHISPAPPPGPAAAGGASCPLRAWLGPYAGLVFNSAGHIQCPTPIIKARAMLAATQPVRALRPQALPIKLIAVGAIAAAANVPCGMWREHTDKFSTQWFLAVHASIPFIAMLRKAVIMPKLAIVCTIAAAIAGQAMGARLERKRLQEATALDASEPTVGMAGVVRLQPVAVAAMTVAGSPALSKRGPAGAAGGPKRASAFKTRAAPGATAGSLLVAAGGSGSSTASGGGWDAQSLASALQPLGGEDGGAEWRMERPHRCGRNKQVLALPSAVTIR